MLCVVDFVLEAPAGSNWSFKDLNFSVMTFKYTHVLFYVHTYIKIKSCISSCIN